MIEKLILKWREVNERGKAIADWPTPGPPATLEDIVTAEIRMGRAIPDDLKQMMLTSSAWLWREKGFDAVVFLPPKSVADEFQMPEIEMSRIFVSSTKTHRANPIYYSKGRITFAYADYYRFQIDEEPTESGKYGQILVVDHDEETIDVIADTFQEFIERGIECLQNQLLGGYPGDGS